MDTIYLATSKGLVRAERGAAGWQVAERTLKEQHVTSVIAREGVILAGTENGVFRSDDGGKTWRAASNGLTHLHVRWIAYHPEIPDSEFVGTEPTGVFVSRDGGENWAARPEVTALRDKHKWMLPYSPEAGCVRGFAFHGRRAYAAVEVGGVLRSDDSGETWALAKGSNGKPSLGEPPEDFVYPDVHDLGVHPSSADLIFAATGNGLYRSQDGGAKWELLYECYCRALWLDANDPNHIIFGPADHVGAVGRIERTRDGGKTWELASDGLQVPWPRTMPERLKQIGDELFCVLDDGRLLSAPLKKLEWSYILKDVKDVNAITWMAGERGLRIDN